MFSLFSMVIVPITDAVKAKAARLLPCTPACPASISTQDHANLNYLFIVPTNFYAELRFCAELTLNWSPLLLWCLITITKPQL